MKNKSLTKDDVQALRTIFDMLAYGGYDASQGYGALVSLAEIIEKVDSKGKKLLKKKKLDPKN